MQTNEKYMKQSWYSHKETKLAYVLPTFATLRMFVHCLLTNFFGERGQLLDNHLEVYWMSTWK